MARLLPAFREKTGAGGYIIRREAWAREERALKIAVLTSGGVAPGMNAAIRAAAQEAFSRGWEVMAVEEGYYGLLEGEIRPVDRSELWGYVALGGTVLGTGRSSEFEEKEEGKQRALELLRD